MPLAGRAIIKLLKDLGWRKVRTKGSHHIVTKGKETISVPVHGNKPLGKGLESKIFKKAGIKKK